MCWANSGYQWDQLHRPGARQLSFESGKQEVDQQITIVFFQSQPAQCAGLTPAINGDKLHEPGARELSFKSNKQEV